VNTLQALLLGLVQGVTEFLPVSSSGHLVMLQALLGVNSEGIVFEVLLHVATLLAIVVFYRKRIGGLIMGSLRGDATSLRYSGKLVLATLPAVGLTLVAKDFLEAQFEDPAVTGVALMLTGYLVWTTKRTVPRASLDEPSWGAALVIGCAQAAAIIPGISRSGTTVAIALALGVRPLVAAEFSFLMGVIAIAGAAVLLLPEMSSLSGNGLSSALIGGVAALLSGLAALWLFVRLLRTRHFYRFAYYPVPVGLAFLAWLWLA
jgi:undecaprenyl-diphosphatase